MKHELFLLAGKIGGDWIDREIAPLYREEGPARDRWIGDAPNDPQD
jgi:hypothetical protein